MRSTSPDTGRPACACNGLLERGQLAPRRHVVGRPEDQADALVARARRRCPYACSIATASSVETRGKSRCVGRRIHEHDRQAQLQQPRVVLVRRVRLGVLAAGEHHPGDLPLEQHLDVFGLRHAAGPRAQHGVETAAARARRRRPRRTPGRSGSAAPAAPARPCRARPRRSLVGPLVAEDVERGQHRRAGGSATPGLPLRTRLTVASLTPACLATSARCRATVQLIGHSLASEDAARSAADSLDSAPAILISAARSPDSTGG